MTVLLDNINNIKLFSTKEIKKSGAIICHALLKSPGTKRRKPPEEGHVVQNEPT